MDATEAGLLLNSRAELLGEAAVQYGPHWAESSLKGRDVQAVVEHQSLSELYMALPVPTQLYFPPFYPA